MLDRLNRSGPTSPGALSGDEGVTGPAIAETLRRLDALGLVERSRDPADGRRVVVGCDRRVPVWAAAGFRVVLEAWWDSGVVVGADILEGLSNVVDGMVSSNG